MERAQLGGLGDGGLDVQARGRERRREVGGRGGGGGGGGGGVRGHGAGAGQRPRLWRVAWAALQLLRLAGGVEWRRAGGGSLVIGGLEINVGVVETDTADAAPVAERGRKE